ncbi:MAG: protein kinase [Labilithrix sp.]|nr:protein kinase [Labilithrix sp.]
MSDASSSSGTSVGIGPVMLEGLPFAVGDTIAGKYRVDRVLGAGGMGVILAGHHVQLDQRVAIKVLKPSAIDNAEYVARFGREARAAAKLRSEHVARVLDVGQTETGLPYMVMEYLSGRDLSQVVREAGSLRIVEAIEYVIQACEGLAEAHRAGIVHRDLKPANLFLTKHTDGTPLVKVLDFGISKMVARAGEQDPSDGLTQTQSMIGSPHYMSPEQLRSARDVDARTDIWSLGGVLFKLLSGDAAFEGHSTADLCVSILTGPPRNLRKLRPAVTEELERVVLKCLAKDPNERYATVGELAQALAAYAPHAAPSVARIERVVASAAWPSEPPPSDPVPTRSPIHDTEANPAPPFAARPMDPATLTSSAAALSAQEGPSASVALPMESRRRTWIFAVCAAFALALVVAGVAFTATRAGDGSPKASAAPPPASAAPIPPIPEASAPAQAASETSDTEPAASTTAPQPSASSASPTRPATRVTHAAPARATSAKQAPKEPPPPAPSPQAPPPATTSNVPDFGGRK